MKCRTCTAPAPAVFMHRGSWCCSAARYNALADRARRIAGARSLGELDDLASALEHAWVQVQIGDEERLALLELIARRRRALETEKPATPTTAKRASRTPKDSQPTRGRTAKSAVAARTKRAAERQC